MKTCLKCHMDYNDTENTCPVCGLTLVPERFSQSRAVSRNGITFRPAVPDPGAAHTPSASNPAAHTPAPRTPTPVIRQQQRVRSTPLPTPGHGTPRRPRPPAPGMLAPLLNALPVVLAVVIVIGLIVAYRNLLKKVIATFVLWWCIGFVLIVVIARRNLQPQTMMTGATVFAVIACICTFNVLGVGAALSGLMQSALYIGIIILGIIIALRSILK